MGLFKDFKEDFADAVDDLTGEEKETQDDVMVNTLEEDVDVDSELNKLDGLLEQVASKVSEPTTLKEKDVKIERAETAPVMREDNRMEENTTSTFTDASIDATNVSDEVAEITRGMVITGDMESSGSINVEGTVKGNVKCNGKLVVNGAIKGNSVSSEFFADNAKIEGEVNTTGTAKIGAGSVIVGNIAATSAVIAGAVKGDIDVQGPVVVDTSAVVMGNIKSRSVQINNGAVIEGLVSQAYADVDIQSVFDIDNK
ncbi:MAG: polymer-forming cytoskeletal protein [Lachnospiraceae bacterium]|nr:polymer-forming cytoskeletal protein [Lachnospiraceae bacterium]